MKYLYIISITFFILSCRCKTDTAEEGPKMQLDIEKNDNLIIKGLNFELSLKYNGNLNVFDSILIKPDSLMLSFDTSNLRIKPRNNYLVGNYSYTLHFYFKSEEYVYQDTLRIVENNFHLSNLRFNYLIYNKKNPVMLSVGYLDYKNCEIESEDNVEIEKIDNFHYLVTPHQEGQIFLSVEAIIDGDLKQIGRVAFQVISDKKQALKEN